MFILEVGAVTALEFYLVREVLMLTMRWSWLGILRHIGSLRIHGQGTGGKEDSLGLLDRGQIVGLTVRLDQE